jgi:hypothetical protein
VVTDPELSYGTRKEKEVSAFNLESRTSLTKLFTAFASHVGLANLTASNSSSGFLRALSSLDCGMHRSSSCTVIFLSLNYTEFRVSSVENIACIF